MKKNTNQSYDKNIMRINSIFSYLENAITSPIYKVINMFMLDLDSCTGNDYYEVYKLILYFHHVLNNLYNLPIIKAIGDKDNLDENNRFINLARYLYGDLKQNLSAENLTYLSRNLAKLKDLKYY